MINKKLAITLPAICLILTYPYTKAAVAKEPIELGSLIEKLTHQSRPGSLFVDWRFMATQDSPITWTSSNLGNRSGQAIISVNGLIADELRETVVPSPWDISLTGPKSGPVKFEINTSGCHDFDSDGVCDDSLIHMISSIKASNNDTKEICRFGTGSEFSRVFSINGEESVYTGITRHAGSGGYSYTIITIPSLEPEEARNNIEETTNICAAFFNDQYGTYGSKYLDYQSILEHH